MCILRSTGRSVSCLALTDTVDSLGKLHGVCYDRDSCMCLFGVWPQVIVEVDQTEAKE